MKPFHLILLAVAFFLTASASAQGISNKYAPFKVDQDHVIHLNTADAAIARKYAEVFKKHGRDPGSPSDWDGVIEQIIGEADTDLLTDGSLNMDATDNEFVAAAETEANVARFMKAVRPYLTSVPKLDEFLTKLDKILRKGK